MERIVKYFRLHAPVSDKAWTHFRERLVLQDYVNGDIIHPAQQPCNKIFFSLRGVARSYIEMPDGQDFTCFFHYADENSSSKYFILFDYPSFNLQTPSTYGFQALSRCQIAFMTYHNLLDTFNRHPELVAIEKQLVISSYQHKKRRLQNLLTKSAKERLEDFKQDHGELFRLIPHYHIASFLGITPQRLCQIRRGSL